MPASVPRRQLTALALGIGLGLGLLQAVPPAAANTLADIQRLEELINATGTETQVRDDCRANHAG